MCVRPVIGAAFVPHSRLLVSVTTAQRWSALGKRSFSMVEQVAGLGRVVK